MEAQALAQVQEGHTRVSTKKLLDELRTNRDKHKAEFENALAGWRKSYASALRDLIDTCTGVAAQLEEGTSAEVNRAGWADLPTKPEDHTNDYDRIIRRLEMSEDSEQFVSHRDFERYVLDNWSWKGTHNEALAAYSQVVR